MLLGAYSSPRAGGLSGCSLHASSLVPRVSYTDWEGCVLMLCILAGISASTYTSIPQACPVTCAWACFYAGISGSRADRQAARSVAGSSTPPAASVSQSHRMPRSVPSAVLQTRSASQTSCRSLACCCRAQYEHLESLAASRLLCHQQLAQHTSAPFVSTIQY